MLAQVVAERHLFAGPWTGWGVGEIAIAIVMIAAIVALVYIALRKFNVNIPDWVIQVFWVLVVCFVIIGAIRLVMTM